jgi:glycosyltransferase involved in cell wall biosynthesis
MGSRPVTVSIVVPMKNEERYIGKCLETILANDFPMDLCEILVMDGRSTDRSRMIVEEKATQAPLIHLLDNPQGIAPTAMNLGIHAASGEYILRMDAHSEYPPNYIRTCLEELERTGADNVGGRWITKPGSNSLVARGIALMTQHPVGVGNSAYRIGLGDRFVDTVPFGAFRKSLFEKIGYYREDLMRHQDYELNARIRKAGGKVYLSSKIDITYYNVPDFARFMRQAYGNGTWMARAWLRSPGSFSLRHGAPLALVSSLLGCLFLSAFSEFFRILLPSIVAIYLLFVLAASVQISLRHGVIFLVVLPALFVLYHSCYGAATLIGFLQHPFKERVRLRDASALRNASSDRPSQPPGLQPHQ